MRLAIADPPYPPYPPMFCERRDLAGGGVRVTMRSRAQRYYGAAGTADSHPAAAEWDNPLRHRQLLEELHAKYDGWAIATTPDGLAAYGTLPIAARIMAWHKPNGAPSGSRLRSSWEPVIVLVPPARRARTTGPSVHDVLTAASPNLGFVGAKPAAWTHWVLDALGHDADTDTVDDLFPGSRAVASALAQGRFPL